MLSLHDLGREFGAKEGERLLIFGYIEISPNYALFFFTISI